MVDREVLLVVVGALGPLLALLAVSFAGPFALLRRYGRSVAGSTDDAAAGVHRLRRIRVFALPLLVALFPLVAISLGSRLVTANLLELVLPIGLPDAVWVPLVWFLALGPFVCAPWLAVTLALHPAERDLRGTGQTRRDRFATWLRQVAVLAGVFWLLAAGAPLVPLDVFSNPLSGAALVTAGYVLLLALSPYVTRLRRETEPLAGAVRDDVEEICAEAGVELQGTYRIDTGQARVANATAAGVPGRYSLFLTDALLEEADPEHVRAIVAHELGHVAHLHVLKRTLLVAALAFSTLLLAGATAESAIVPGLAFAVYLFVVRGWLGQRDEHEADEYAAAVAGTETTIGALESLASMNTMQRSSGPLYSLLVRHPSIDDRIKHLRARVE